MTSSPWPGARGRGGAAGAVSNRAHPSAAFQTLRRRALPCRRPQDVDRPVSHLARSGMACLCCHPQVQDVDQSSVQTLGVDCGHPQDGHSLARPGACVVRALNT
jgi:hypothetical protein